MKEIVDFINKVGETLGAAQYERNDVVDILRLEFHSRRQDRTRAPTAMVSMHPAFGPVYTARGGRARANNFEGGSYFKQVIELFESKAPRAADIAGFFAHVEKTEKALHTAEKRVANLVKAKKVVEVPDEARHILNELATLNEGMLEAKTLRRSVRQLSEKARAYTAPVLIEDDRPDGD